MPIWSVQPSLEQLNAMTTGTMVEHLGIEFTEIGEDYITARMPLDRRTIQPAGLLHGGASATLAETLGSVAANLCVRRAGQMFVGMEINANHLRPVREGFVYGTVRPLHIGRSTHVWEIRIENGAGKLVCASRLTLAAVEVEGA
jgi:uncharacterized protein (TIGR00369 family)